MKVNNPNYLNGLTVSAEQINAAVEGGGAGLTPEQTTTLGKLDGITSSASEIDDSVGMTRVLVNPINPVFLKTGYINGYTESTHASYWKYTDFIEVEEGDNLVLFLANGVYPLRAKVLSFYNENKNSVSSISDGITGMIVPSGVKYIRFCVYKSEVAKEDLARLQLGFNGIIEKFTPFGYSIPRKSLAGDTTLKFKDTSILAYGDSITANSEWLKIVSQNTGITNIKNMAIGGANLSSLSTRPIGNIYDWRTNYPNSASDDYNDRNLIPQVAHTPNTLRWKYDIVNNNYLDAEGKYIFKPDIVIIAIGFNDYKWTNSYESYSDVKDLTYSELEARRDANPAQRQIFTCLRLVLEDLMNGEILETQDGYTYGVDASMSNFYFVTPIQSAYPIPYSTTLLELGDMINECLEDYSVKRIDGFRNIGICSKYEINGGNGRYLKDGIHPNDNGYIKMGKFIAGQINASFSE